MLSSVKLAMLETSHVGIDSLEQFYKMIFLRLGYETEVFRISSEDESSHNGSGVFEDKPIDVFVSDLSLGKQDTYDGLTVIKKIKRAFPNLLVIANSMTNVTFVEAASHIPSFDLFICKSKMLDKVYQNYILEKLKRLFARNVYLDDYDLDLSKSKFFRKKRGHLQLIDILKIITFTSNNVDESTSVKKIVLSPIFGGYSSSEVYKLSAYTSSNLKCINAVLKISSNKSYIEERENYLKYVKWYLPYTWRPELMGCAETKDYGALCYSFVYNDEVPFKSLTECLRDDDIDKLKIGGNEMEEKIILVQVFGSLSGELWDTYRAGGNGNGGSVAKNLIPKLPDSCLVRECPRNTELKTPYYRIFLGIEIATTVVARSLALYKKFRTLFHAERRETDFRLAMLGVKFKINKESGENGFFVPPTAEKEIDFLFIRESDPTFSYEAKNWNMFFKSFRDHLPMVFE